MGALDLIYQFKMLTFKRQFKSNFSSKLQHTFCIFLSFVYVCVCVLLLSVILPPLHKSTNDISVDFMDMKLTKLKCVKFALCIDIASFSHISIFCVRQQVMHFFFLLWLKAQMVLWIALYYISMWRQTLSLCESQFG